MNFVSRTISPACFALATISVLAAAPAQAQSADTSFFVTSTPIGNGGNLGGLAGADNQCQTLAQAAGANAGGVKTWRAYLSTQAAWSNEDVAKLHTLATPEMVSYFTKDLEQNKANNDVNKVSDVKLLQGDLSEAWREGETDYATVAMKISLVDKTLERGTNRVVDGSDTPVEVTEVWTFARQRGGNWEVSAIQQTT